MLDLGNTAPKAEWRAALLAARRGVVADVRRAEAGALAAGLRAALPELALVARGTAGAFAPRAPEPGSLELADVLRAWGQRVLLPVSGPAGALDWAEYTGRAELQNGRFGLAEPVGERFGGDAVREAGVLLVPALAVDDRGVRLGRGGGYYDRALALVPAATLVAAVVRDEELVRSLPAEPHDAAVSAVLTPGRGLVRLPASGPR